MLPVLSMDGIPSTLVMAFQSPAESLNTNILLVKYNPDGVALHCGLEVCLSEEVDHISMLYR